MSQSKAYRTKEAIYNYTLGGITLIHSFDELFSYKTTKNMYSVQEYAHSKNHFYPKLKNERNFKLHHQ